jgi:biopolymer transport protein ExbD
MAARISQGGGKYDLGQNAEINVTPFVDVMLVLLIIFMVAAPLATATLKVDLPQVTRNPTAQPQQPVFIDVGLGGRVYVQGVETSYPKLIAAVTARITDPNPTEQRIMIRGDKAVPYGDFIKVMNTLQRSGFTRLGLVGEETI